jgi:hypothetical protein
MTLDELTFDELVRIAEDQGWNVRYLDNERVWVFKRQGLTPVVAARSEDDSALYGLVQRLIAQGLHRPTG